MNLATWVNAHGLECLLIYYIFAAIVGSMPPLPENATYWARWGASLIHALSANIRMAAQLLNVKTEVSNEPKP